MPTSKSRRKTLPKRVLALPDLEHAKAAVLSSLTSCSGQRTYDHAIREFVAWYCSEPRLAFNRTVVLRYRIHLEQLNYAPATVNLRLAAVRRVGVTEGTVFRAINKAGRVWGDGMTAKVLWDVVRTAASDAGIDKLAPHDLRRTCARLCHLAGGELDQIQVLLGHVSIQTTEHYLGCKQRLRCAVNDRLGIEPDAA
jgi:hypothetical protein